MWFPGTYKIRENLWCTLITSLTCIIETETMSKETALVSLQRSKGVHWQFLLDFQNCAGKQCNLQCRFCHRLGHLTHCETRSPEILFLHLDRSLQVRGCLCISKVCICGLVQNKKSVTIWLFNPTGCETQYVRFLFGRLPSSGERVSFIYQKQCIWPQGTTLTDTCCG